MDQKTIAKLRGWMRKYGHGGVLLAGGYLVLHHLATKRRMASILSASSLLCLGTLCLQREPPSAVPPIAFEAPDMRTTRTTPEVDIDADLLDAVRNDDLFCAEVALDSGADANASEPLEYYTLVTRHEADYSVPVSQIKGETALAIAVQHNNVAMIQVLRQAGARE